MNEATEVLNAIAALAATLSVPVERLIDVYAARAWTPVVEAAGMAVLFLFSFRRAYKSSAKASFKDEDVHTWAMLARGGGVIFCLSGGDEFGE